jgi:hypothetical protein
MTEDFSVSTVKQMSSGETASAQVDHPRQNQSGSQPMVPPIAALRPLPGHVPTSLEA